ncbi:dihydroneopterin aldolase [Methylocella silvestris BL2]|uniref:4-(hydroxymethyl)-2-furancarboxaldehyde-phosphate synthase n=1 Tax=Methylocella silvestris (strain DSM 15510 / CIP 108128 / LMG 27833 / NCIMB 13906 / BL2) TaxID=395965 RepID=B8EKF6_METSB|nr:(5-formylfuran-3-yl)methyl phosphate synthase [Methylocella silvestris]ACK51326.1 dihydroneopterin aldolase [Methylocella silvestris BL2]
MTAMLASVINGAEAETALASAVDMIDLKDPARGALGALPAGLVASIVATVAGRKKTSAAAGDQFAAPADAVEAARALVATGVDFVKIGLQGGAAGAAIVDALGAHKGDAALIGVLFADQNPDLDLLNRMAERGFKGAMLDTFEKGAGRLLDHMDVAALAPFVDRCRELGLICGLAGSLEAPDVPRLLPLRPDYLGFRGSLCKGGERGGALDLAAVAMIRDLIPHVAENGSGAGAADVDWRLLGRGYVPVNEATETDLIFVHDLIMPCFIGAYEYERARKQDVRFNIDVDVARARLHSDDMRDIFSYDLIVDAIKIITGRGHIELVETLVREIAESVLVHPSVISVRVRAEKLDVIRGSVGVEIKRERAKEAAAFEGLFGVDAAAAKLKKTRSPRSH